MKINIKNTNETSLASIAIALDAGAGKDLDILGLAHVVEHMLYKATNKRTEVMINEDLSKIFAFQNAMTNYSYVVYYGTFLEEDLEKVIELFSDILLNPNFTNKSLEEEIKIIKQELKEWDEDLEQYCEDKLFLNCFKNSRLKYPIIGTLNDLDKINISDVKDFYEKYYCLENMSISVICNNKNIEVEKLIKKYFNKVSNNKICENIIYDNLKSNIFIEEQSNFNQSRVQVVFPISDLNDKEISALKVFDQYFCVGVSSILFHNLRTVNSLVYDVLSKINYDNYIKLYKIMYTTSKENLDKSLNLIDRIIENIEEYRFDEEQKRSLIKAFKLKKSFEKEQSVRGAILNSTHEIMFDSLELLDYEKSLDNLTIDFIFDTVKKIFENKVIQIIK